MAALPVVDNQPNAELFALQMEENKRMASAVEDLIKQQQQTAQITQQLHENMQSMLETQEELQLQLEPVL